MSELKPRITENGIDYILVGDYYIPDLKLPEEHRPIGKYGRLHREYLREVHPALTITWDFARFNICVDPLLGIGLEVFFLVCAFPYQSCFI